MFARLSTCRVLGIRSHRLPALREQMLSARAVLKPGLAPRMETRALDGGGVRGAVQRGKHGIPGIALRNVCTSCWRQGPVLLTHFI